MVKARSTAPSTGHAVRATHAQNSSNSTSPPWLLSMAANAVAAQRLFEINRKPEREFGITLEIANTMPPADRSNSHRDSRRLGLGIDWVELEPAWSGSRNELQAQPDARQAPT